MPKLVRTFAAALMLNFIAGDVMAATQASCARPHDRGAVNAAMQQRLILTALTCDASHGYNSLLLAFLFLKEKARTEGYQELRTRGQWRASAASSVMAEAQTGRVTAR